MIILIVDDFPSNRNLLNAIFSHEGFHVLEAADGAEALHVLERERVDVILSDVLMPNVDGYRLCSEVRKRKHLDSVPFLFHTSTYTSSSDEAFALTLGADKFIRKPVSARTVINAVRELLAAERPVRRSIELPADDNLTAEYTQRLVAKLEEKNKELFERTQEAHGTSEKLRALILGAPVAISSCDADMIIEVWNPAAERIFCWKAEEVIGRPVTEVMAQLGSEVPPFDAGGGPTLRGIAATMRARDGSVVHAEVSVSPVFDSEGNFAGRIAIFVDVTERKMAEEALEKAKQRMESLSRQLLAIGEAERRRIARELHDEIGQGLTAAKIAIESAKVTGDAAARSLRLDDGIAVIEHLLQSVRTLSLDLRPAALDELGLVATLRAYIPSQAARAGIKTRFEADTLPPSGNGEAEIACFRVVQEAMTNVIRHAKATSVEIDLRRHGDEVRLLFQDDGAGFDVALATAGTGSHSFGLLSMRERTQLAGGRFLITSASGQGTRIEATFPW